MTFTVIQGRRNAIRQMTYSCLLVFHCNYDSKLYPFRYCVVSFVWELLTAYTGPQIIFKSSYVRTRQEKY